MQLDILSQLFNNLWLIFLVIFVVLPAYKRAQVVSSRRDLLRRISLARKSQVITLIHRQETVSFLGIPLSRYIDLDDSEEVLRAIRMTPKDVPIDLIIHTPGGLALAATQIALALKSHPAKKTVIVPHYAMSGGTLIALAADNIIMDQFAVLGPVDPQLGDQTGTYPAASLIRIAQQKSVDRTDDKTLVMVDEAKKAMRQIETLVREIVQGKCSASDADQIVMELVSGKYTHDYPFTASKAKALLGDCISTEMPSEVYQFMRLYDTQMASRKPGVEYIPMQN